MHSHSSIISSVFCENWSLPNHDIKSKLIPCPVPGWPLTLFPNPGDTPSQQLFLKQTFPFSPSWPAFLSGGLFTELLQTHSIVDRYSHNFVPGISKYNILLHVSAPFSVAISSLSSAQILLSICQLLSLIFMPVQFLMESSYAIGCQH